MIEKSPSYLSRLTNFFSSRRNRENDEDPTSIDDLLTRTIDVNKDGRPDYKIGPDGELVFKNNPTPPETDPLTDTEHLDQVIERLVAPVLDETPLHELSLNHIYQIITTTSQTVLELSHALEHEMTKTPNRNRVRRSHFNASLFQMRRVYPTDLSVCGIAIDDLWTMFSGDYSVGKKQERIQEIRTRLTDYIRQTERNNTQRSLSQMKEMQFDQNAFDTIFTGTQKNFRLEQFDAGVFSYLVLHAQSMQIFYAELRDALGNHDLTRAQSVLLKLKSYLDTINREAKTMGYESALSEASEPLTLPSEAITGSIRDRYLVVEMMRLRVQQNQKAEFSQNQRQLQSETWTRIAARLHLKKRKELSILQSVGEFWGEGLGPPTITPIEQTLRDIAIVLRNLDYPKYQEALRQAATQLDQTESETMTLLKQLYVELAFGWLEEMTEEHKSARDEELKTWLLATHLFDQRSALEIPAF